MTIQNVLWETAVEQDGYVTTLDARDAGVPVVELAKLAHRGKLRRAAHGVYRFDSLPVGRGDHYRLAVLWTGNRNTVLSHDTALDLLGLCDINPDDVHITVPKQARIRRAGRPEVVVHHENLDVKDLAWWEGIRCVNEFTAIRQGIDTGVPVHLLREAIGTARSRGRITPADERALATRLDERFVS
ncbi:type IV toxin-antitoxin system AbiEi family antitoxin domain-containing protein [Glaciibacter superstes]|uniref:type IV toxin-antitoxin system AbiEi family antitoxin domain-containing protein n=1 Tax=Glaciibacter superstes TaxID=501023 RepID=UPI0003B3F5E0|nr:type IV toxin-antitoxin system AbiEi family antitoxin domain-containing protein [Glaciibacter superstes]